MKKNQEIKVSFNFGPIFFKWIDIFKFLSGHFLYLKDINLLYVCRDK